MIKDEVSLAGPGPGRAADLSISSLLFLHQTGEILTKPTLACSSLGSAGTPAVKTKTQSALRGEMLSVFVSLRRPISAFP